MTTDRGWGADVAHSEVHGHPCRVYRDRRRTIVAVLDQIQRWPDRTFIVHGDRHVTFGEFARLTRAVADRLASCGVSRGDRVAIYAANSPEWAATFFAVLKLGGIVVPCNGWWSAEELAHACATCGPAFLVADERHLRRVPAGLSTIPIEWLSTPAEDLAPSIWDDPEVDEDAPAVILFTAGTTNFPKGAVLSHRALVANLQTLLIVSNKLPHQIGDDNPASVTLVGLPLFHIGAIQLILVPLMTGSRIVFLEGRFEASAVLRLVEHEGVTMFSGVPTMMERLLAHGDLGHRDVRSLRTVVLGGSPVDDGLLARVAAAFPSTTRGVGQTYGLTEAGGVVSTGVGADIRTHPGSSGRLAPVVEVRVKDPDSSGTGEILVRSPACMDGYWGLPDDTTIDDDGWVATGDLGRVDAERFLYVTGRIKDVIIRGGENISAGRVEAVLREYPGVAEVAVVGLEDADLGEVVGAVVVASSPAPKTGELTAFAAERLGHFEVPARWWLRTEPLPTNAAGKVLKRELVAGWPPEAQSAVPSR
ncbi:class I adenylate-forming enzyme family protein [Amycolatopsis sp. GM8]|uniref:class I adenylate-forming enzyme family protein n=1 Tax=Amycolatopsis sp. GM8 TaxID=2896530 RepID=UPI001F28F62A|nr:class I adenylate-forming enzyme family protein [Amycolatopsis sp. GM8]